MLESPLQRTTSDAYIVRPLPWRKLHHIVDAIDVFVGPHRGFQQQRRMEEPERSPTDTCLVFKSRWLVSVRERGALGPPYLYVACIWFSRPCKRQCGASIISDESPTTLRPPLSPAAERVQESRPPPRILGVSGSFSSQVACAVPASWIAGIRGAGGTMVCAGDILLQCGNPQTTAHRLQIKSELPPMGWAPPESKPNYLRRKTGVLKSLFMSPRLASSPL